MRWDRIGYWAIWLLGMGASFLACTTNQPSHSPLFQEIFVDDSSTFRGCFLGADMTRIPRQEQGQSPEHQDLLGITYHIALSPGYLMIVDYYSDHLKAEQDSQRLASIVANILVNDEVETAKLYEEIRAYFQARYGISSGLYGNYQWQSSNAFTHSMEVILRLNEDKKGITLNYVDTQPRQAAVSYPSAPLPPD
ncbi:MAG: hypothetical protein D6722_00285 [Bacteroidetes bacterium]|nr:MAG: hypothetical protein D6722_00285 [Bacteroidota bacterium]